MGFDRSMRGDGQQTLRVSNEELARMVARLGVTVQKLTARVEYLEKEELRVAARNARQRRRREQLQKLAQMAAVTEKEAARKADLAVSRAAITELLRTDKPRSIAEIVAEVSAEFEIRVHTILGRSRDVDAVAARQQIYLRARDAGYGFAQIGRAVGRDHSTVLHALNVALVRQSTAVAHA